jgi:hypothetical protein
VFLVADACGSTTVVPGSPLSTGARPGTSGTPPPGATIAPAATPPAPAATQPTPGLSWVKAADVERPADAFANASAEPTQPTGPGTAGHPGNFLGQAIVDDVAAVDGRLVAVGYVGIAGVWTAIAWTSTDGQTWSLAPVDDAPGSFAVVLTAARGSGSPRLVAVGRSGNAPVAWTSDDGQVWVREPMPTLSGGAEWERATTVIATPTGFLAGGSVGPELGDRRARFWRSADGRTWQPVPDDAGMSGAEVGAIRSLGGGGFVAVGRLGTGQRAVSSVAWTSADGIAWRRSDDTELAQGLVAGLATLPDGTIVAVGSDPDERAADIWTSADGVRWSLAPSEPSRLYGGEKIRMTAVTAAGRGLVAVGNRVGVQYGTATSWVSGDGRTWLRSPGYPALEQGEMLAVAATPGRLVAVGSFGAPDNYIPTIWLSALPGG